MPLPPDSVQSLNPSVAVDVEPSEYVIVAVPDEPSVPALYALPRKPSFVAPAGAAIGMVWPPAETLSGLPGGMSGHVYVMPPDDTDAPWLRPAAISAWDE